MSERPDPKTAVVEIVAIQLGCSSVRAGDRLLEDLGTESADLVNIAAAIEDRFELQISEEELAAVRTVADLTQLVGRAQL